MSLLKQLVAFKSISFDEKYRTEIEKTVTWYTKLFQNNNFKLKVIRGYDNPIIFAELQISPKYQTVLIYGHYDVQPASIEDGWDYNPFQLHKHGNRLYARGVIDNKGQHLVHLATVLELMKNKKLAYNIKFFIEGNEETGSPNIEKFFKDFKKQLKADFVLISDGELVAGHPNLNAGYRGITNCSVILQTAKTDLHSGIYGGAAPNAAKEMIRLLSKIYDNNHKVAIPGFYQDVADTKPEIKRYNKQIPFNLNEYKTITGAKAVLLPRGTDDGSLINKVSSNAEEIKTITKNNNIKLVPAIAMFDHELFSSVLHEQNNLDRHVDQIYKTVMSNNYDGIDLDYESTKLADKELYFEFLKKLSLKLKQNNKILIVTVLAKWGDQIKYPSLPETREVQDWQRIAELANQVRIMAYDYTFIQSQFPGPIAPLNWVKDILDYAVTKIPREKIILGIHLYAYEWWLEVDENTDQEFSTLTFITNYLLNNNSEKSARSYTYETVQRVLTENNGKKSQYQGEQIFEYQKVNDVTKKLENRILIYIDPEGIKKRAELAKQYQIAGVAYWRNIEKQL